MEGQRRGPVGEHQLGVDLVDGMSARMAICPRCFSSDLTARIPQYSRLISTSMGALATLSAFFAWKREWFSEMSASKPTAKVAAARERPRMVRYCRCQP